MQLADVYVLYDKDTGFIKGTGRVVRVGSEIPPGIKAILDKDKNRRLLWLSVTDDIPDPLKFKVSQNSVVAMTQEEQDTAALPKKVSALKLRIFETYNLKAAAEGLGFASDAKVYDDLLKGLLNELPK